MTSPLNRCKRLMVIGLDGATLDVLTPLAEQGLLPNLSRWLRAGRAQQLISTVPAVTPVAWSTFLTGCDPARHGVWDFRRFDHGDGQLRLHNAASVQRPTLFDAIAQAGGETVSIDLPMTWPVHRSHAGIVLGGFDSPSRETTLEAYPRLAAELRRRGAALSLDAVWTRPPRNFEELSAGVQRTQLAFHERVTAAQVCDGLSDWRLMVVQFQALDALQHRCWHLLGLHGARATVDRAPTRWIVQTQAALRSLDACVGELCELAERRGAQTLIVSDHGFGEFRGEIRINEILRRAGLQRPLSAAARARQWTQRLRWKLSRWQTRRRTAGASLAGIPRPALAALPCDPRRSVASCLHGDLAAMIYLHAPGRFGAGPVRTAGQAAQALADVRGALLAQSDSQRGEPLLVEFISLAERFDVDVLERGWPDALAVAADGFHTAVKPGPRGRIVTANRRLTGTHRRAGVLLAEDRLTPDDGPTAAAASPHLRDVAPTILAALRVPAVGPMDGRSLWPADGGSEPTHEEMASFAGVAARQDAARASSAAFSARCDSQRAVESRLRSLGYLS